MPTCVESAGDDRLWKGSKGKEAGTTIGSNEDRSSRQKKKMLSRVFLHLPFFSFAFWKKVGLFSLFPGDIFFRRLDLLGSSYPRDRLSRVLLFSPPGIGDGGGEGGLVRAF